jgi:secernin
MDTSCDTLVVLGLASATGRTIFAKNSDRPLAESQPLFLAPRRSHRPGATVRCQYVEVPQVPETLAVLGSRPFWLWGFEHGVNECRVAIGNEALHTREEPADTGFLGMDLIRLGLERGRTAREAQAAITGLLQAHGQGGSAAYGGSRRYHNSFIIADPAEAFVLETSGRHWVSRRVRDRAAISNLATIGDDWDEASPGIEAYAAERGWWTPASGRRFDFRAAFENPEPRYRAEARYDASCRFLSGRWAPGVADLMRHLRDHYDGGTVHHPGRKDGDPRGWSVCMHPEPATGHTAASMVVELSPPPGPLVAWCSMTAPCGSAFLPVTLDADLPPALTTAGPEPAPDSAWWLLRALEDEIQQDPARRTPAAQAVWHGWERELLAETARDPGGAGRRLPERVAALLDRRRHLLDQLARMGGQP